jgi:hypothetical protein
MDLFFSNLLSNFLANIFSNEINNIHNTPQLQKKLIKPSTKYINEISIFLEILFPINSPKIRRENLYLLPNSSSFFIEKMDIIDSLMRDEQGSVSIICRLPWLVMPDTYRDICLDSTEARGYYAMLENASKTNKLRYLYNYCSISKQNLHEVIDKGQKVHCLPMLLSSTNFDIMIVHTDRHRHKIIFAQRPIGSKDQEIGIVSEQKDLYFVFQDYFDKLWNDAENFWSSENEQKIAPLIHKYLNPLVIQ